MSTNNQRPKVGDRVVVTAGRFPLGTQGTLIRDDESDIPFLVLLDNLKLPDALETGNWFFADRVAPVTGHTSEVMRERMEHVLTQFIHRVNNGEIAAIVVVSVGHTEGSYSTYCIDSSEEARVRVIKQVQQAVGARDEEEED